MKFLAAIALPLYALDQITKWWVYTHYALIPTQENIDRFRDVVEKTAHLPAATSVIPGWFEIVHHANTGAAFSIGRGNNSAFIALSIVAFIAILAAVRKNVFPDKLSMTAVGLILSGILGNVTDRLIHGYVVDFISVDLHVRYANPWPTFNVADSCIFIAAALFIIAGFIDAKRAKAKSAAESKG